MKEIRIGPTGQLVAIAAVLAVILAFLAMQAPEVRRYLKVRSM